MHGRIKFQYHDLKGIGKETGICRRDPSNIIRFKDRYYVWYTKVHAGAHLYPSGYSGTVWYSTSNGDVHSWEEQGEAIPHSVEGFDSKATFTPNILVYKGKFYLTYTAVAKGFTLREFSDINRTSIGMAVAAAPEGPWTKLDSNPILESTRDVGKFDSYRVDDSCFVIRDGKVWLYYKGRQWNNTPRNTKMGVAIAERPGGPYTRQNQGNCVQDSGHEVSVWPHDGGVMSIVANAGPHGQTLQFSEDGLAFRVIGNLPKNFPKAPNAFREDFSGNPSYDEGIRWGISQAGDAHPYLRYFRIVYDIRDGYERFTNTGMHS